MTSNNDPHGLTVGIIEHVIELLNLNGSEYTDGECLDEIAIYLESVGFVVFPKSENAE
jgi:hypothetical protein